MARRRYRLQRPFPYSDSAFYLESSSSCYPNVVTPDSSRTVTKRLRRRVSTSRTINGSNYFVFSVTGSKEAGPPCFVSGFTTRREEICSIFLHVMSRVRETHTFDRQRSSEFSFRDLDKRIFAGLFFEKRLPFRKVLPFFPPFLFAPRKPAVDLDNDLQGFESFRKNLLNCLNVRMELCKYQLVYEIRFHSGVAKLYCSSTLPFLRVFPLFLWTLSCTDFSVLSRSVFPPWRESRVPAKAVHICRNKRSKMKSGA